MLATLAHHTDYHEMNGVLGKILHCKAILNRGQPGLMMANEMNFAMNHAPGAGLIARPVDQQSSILPLYYGCPH